MIRKENEIDEKKGTKINMSILTKYISKCVHIIQILVFFPHLLFDF